MAAAAEVAAARADEAEASEADDAARADEADAAEAARLLRVAGWALWRDETELALLLIETDLARMVDFCDDRRDWRTPSLLAREDSLRASIARGELAGHVARFWTARLLRAALSFELEKPKPAADATDAAARRETTVWPKSIAKRGGGFGVGGGGGEVKVERG